MLEASILSSLIMVFDKNLHPKCSMFNVHHQAFSINMEIENLQIQHESTITKTYRHQMTSNIVIQLQSRPFESKCNHANIEKNAIDPI